MSETPTRTRYAPSIQQRARQFSCRPERGGCGARRGEFCVTGQGKKSYTAHLDRLEQENDAWHLAHNRQGQP
jgi:hypothetical protein